jgi:hypothetical protein
MYSVLCYRYVFLLSSYLNKIQNIVLGHFYYVLLFLFTIEVYTFKNLFWTN